MLIPENLIKKVLVVKQVFFKYFRKGVRTTHVIVILISIARMHHPRLKSRTFGCQLKGYDHWQVPVQLIKKIASSCCIHSLVKLVVLFQHIESLSIITYTLLV